MGGGRDYPICIGAGALALTAKYAPPHVAVVSNPTVFSLYGDAIKNALQEAGKKSFTIMVDDGEAHKNMRSLGRILDAMTAAGLARDGGVIALGGGVIGDLAGFAAAVYMRGVAVTQVPTSLLAQVDAAIGGKTGINHPQGKNLIGAFYQPRAVLCDTTVLSSLPKREYCAGLAEVVKYGLLGDAAFFEWLEQNAVALAARETAAVLHVLEQSARAKADIVVADERESSGRRALLNLGHTFAHAVETKLGYGEWLHGEAVAAGLVAAARLSEQTSGFAAAETARIISLLSALSLPTDIPSQISSDSLLAAMELDKKNLHEGRRFVLMRRIGDAYLDFVGDAPLARMLADRS